MKNTLQIDENTYEAIFFHKPEEPHGCLSNWYDKWNFKTESRKKRAAKTARFVLPYRYFGLRCGYVSKTK